MKECDVSAAAAVAAAAAAAPLKLVEPAESAMRAFETDDGDGDGVRENDAASASDGCIAACVNAKLIVCTGLVNGIEARQGGASLAESGRGGREGIEEDGLECVRRGFGFWREASLHAGRSQGADSSAPFSLAVLFTDSIFPRVIFAWSLLHCALSILVLKSDCIDCSGETAA